jgi:DNA replication protein DnaC
MLTHPTLEKLRSLKLFGMAQALAEQLETRAADDLSFEARLGLLVDREAIERDNRKLSSLLRKANLRQKASLEDLDYKHPRGLDKSLMLSLASGSWLAEHRHVCVTGATGVGKTFIACALAQAACRQGYSARYFRTSRLLQELQLAKGDGSYLKRMKALANSALLVLDDFGIEPLASQDKHTLLELLDDRFDRASTLIASQLPTSLWHDFLGDNPTLADAILDRILHNAYRIELKGESLRKARATSL